MPVTCWIRNAIISAFPAIPLFVPGRDGCATGTTAARRVLLRLQDGRRRRLEGS